MDAIITLKTLLDAITIPPEAGGAAIPKVVQVGWLDTSASKGTNGQLKPTYTIIRSTLAPVPFAADLSSEQYTDNIQIDCWCGQYGTENANLLMEKMLVQLRAAIKGANLHPNTSANALILGPEVPRDEIDTKPMLKRTMVMVYAKGFR